MYAVIEDSGTQFKVTGGDVIRIDRQQPEDGNWPESITFDRVLFVGGDGSSKIGAPILDGVTVTAEVLGEVKGKKLRVAKYKRRKGYHVETGHRQKYLQVKIGEIKA